MTQIVEVFANSIVVRMETSKGVLLNLDIGLETDLIAYAEKVNEELSFLEIGLLLEIATTVIKNSVGKNSVHVLLGAFLVSIVKTALVLHDSECE